MTYLPETLSSDIITLGIRVSAYALWTDTNMQSTARLNLIADEKLAVIPAVVSVPWGNRETTE